MPSWKGKTRGGLLGYKIFIYILNKMGVPATYMLLRGVSCYYVFSAPSASVNIFRYFRKIQQFNFFKALISVYKSYYTFGQTLIDKIAMSSGLRDQYTSQSDGFENLEKLKTTGGIVISAHLGSWDIAGLLLDKYNVKINILVFEAEHEKIKQYLGEVMKNRSVSMIVMKQDLSHIIKINMALKSKEIICMHGDRFIEGSRIAKKKFMDHEAFFPLGPFNIVSKLKVPYIFAFALRNPKRNYQLYASEVTYDKRTPDDILNEYVSHLEEKLKAYPYQWFNYYDFWSNEVKGATIN